VHFIQFTLPAPGPLGSVTFLGDSGGIGAGRYAPTLPDQLAARGWGPVRFQAVDGGRTGYPPGWPDYFNAVPLIDQWQAEGWDSDTWILILGANDSGYCSADVACARAAIMLVVETIGPGHRIWWPKITRLYTHQYQADAWNMALDQIDAERDDFWTWDWPSEMSSHPDAYGSWDHTHLYPDGYRLRSAVMAQAFTDAVAVGHRVGGDVPLPPAIGSPTAIVAVDPTRVLDTRLVPDGRLQAGGQVAIDLSGTVPAGATAVAVNVGAVHPSAPGYLTAFACDRSRPETSNVNYAWSTRAAGAVVALSSATTMCVASSAPTDVIVDLQAVFVPPSTAGAVRLSPLPTPVRLVDTRESGRSHDLTVSVPAGASAVAVNITVTGATAPGFATAYPCGREPPLISNVNVTPGDTNASAGFVRVGEGSSICVHMNTDADVTVDLTGTLQASLGLLFVPAEPRRLLDTRSAIGGWSPVHGAGQTFDIGAAPPGAGAVTGTLTLVAPLSPSYLAASPCGTVTATSSVNADAGAVVANSVTVGVSPGDGRLCLAARAAGHTVFDVTGWWVAS
jgi:hypothetical protein